MEFIEWFYHFSSHIKRSIYLHCYVCRAPKIFTLHLQSTMSRCHPTWQIRLFMLPIARSNDIQRLNWQIVSTLIATNLASTQSATRWMPHLWPKSSQRSTLLPKVGLGGEEMQQHHHDPCTTDAWKCRGPPAQDLCYRWFALPLLHKSKRLTWPSTQGSMLCYWMHLNNNATLTIMMTRIATIIMMLQYSCKTTAPLQPNRLQQSTISWQGCRRSWSQTVVGQQDERFIQKNHFYLGICPKVIACSTVPTNASDTMWETINANAFLS